MLKYKPLYLSIMKLRLNVALLLFLILIPAVLSANVDLDKLDAVKFSIAQGDEKTLQFNGAEYKVRADSVSDNEARLTFLPVNYAAAVGKEQKADIDIDEDSEIDFSLTFVSSADKTVSLEAKRIGPKKIKAETDSGKSKSLPDITVLSNALRQNSKYVLGAGAVLVVIILIVVVSKRKGNPDKWYRKAEDLHKEAQEFHDDGDDETAVELYEKAEEFREKARGLERGGI